MNTHSFRTVQRLGLVITLLCGGASPLMAQTVSNPRVLEFSASADHATVLADGRQAVERYDLRFYNQGASQPFQTSSLGKPAPGTGGLIALDLASTLTSWPLSAGIVYEARVSAVGPGGSAESSASNPFVFSAPCTYPLSTTSVSMTASAGTGSVTVNTTSGCAWTSSSNAAWITITSGSSLTGPGFVQFSVAANTASTSRTGTLTIAGQTVTVTQAGAPCSFTLSTTSASFTSSAGSGAVGVTAGSGCTWTAASNAAWIAVSSGGSGTGNGTVAFTVAANTSATSRTGTLTIAGKTVTVTQAGAPCSFTLSTTSASFTSTGGSGSVGVTAGTGCTWTAASSTAWITVSGGGTGNGTAAFTVAPNTSSASRTGTLTIAGQTVTVTQAGAPCSFTLSTTSASFTSSGGGGSVGVTAGSGCTWTVASNAAWITVGGGGTGNGTATFTVAPNTSAASRTGTLTVAGQTVTVTQAGAPCSYSLSTTSASFTSSAGSGAVGVTAGSGCTWTAASNAAWIAVSSGGSGTGNGTVAFTIAENTSSASRTATLTVAGQTVTVTQAGAPCSYTLASGSASFTSAGGSGLVGVTSNAGCTWTAQSNVAWITIIHGSSGTGEGTVAFTVAENSLTVPRTGTLTVAGQTVTITQAAAPCTYTLATISASFTSTGGSGSIGVGSATGCTWTAASNAGWITLAGSNSGSGNGSVAFTVAANSSTSPRTGTLTIAGQTVTVTQAGAPCSFTLSTTSASFTSTGGSGAVGVTSDTGCTWTSASNAAWITVGGGGTGTGSLTFTVAANTSTTSRTGTLTIAGQTVTVAQAGEPCAYSLTTSTSSFTAAGGSASVGVTTTSECAWNATSSAGWITVTGGSSGTGNGSVAFSVAANTSASPRTGSVAIAGRILTVEQAADDSCAYSLSASSQQFPSEGGSGSVNVAITSGTGCTWNASSSSDWLTITAGASGNGPGTVSFAAAPNTTSTERSGTIDIAGVTFAVSVAAAAQERTVDVSTEEQLQAAVESVTSKTTIVIAPGTYALSRTLRLSGRVEDVTLRGSTGSARDVVLVGQGMNNSSYGNVPSAIVVGGGVQSLTVADLTIRDVYMHAIQLEPAARAPRLSNLYLLNAGQSFVRADLDPTLGGVHDGVVERTLFERTQVSRDANTTALEVRGGARWHLRGNAFRNLSAPAGQMGTPAVLMTHGSANTITEQNTFVNCQRGIAYGWTDREGYDHVGGTIRNNFLYRAASLPGEASIMVVDSPNTHVVHNTILTSGTYPTPIEYRFADTVGVLVANNLLDGNVWARDGAVGDSTSNDGTAAPWMFVNAASGNLHLAPGAPAVDRAAPLVDALNDMDGDPRPSGPAADLGADEAPPANQPPTVSLDAPADNTAFTGRGNIQLAASASDPDGTVAAVEFYANSTLIRSVSSAPYTTSWKADGSGTYVITAVAIDDAGARTVSAPVTITVNMKGKGR